MHIVFQFHEYFYLIQHDVYDIHHEFVDIFQFVFLMQEFQKQHFVEEFDQIQLDKQNSFHNLKQLFANPKDIFFNITNENIKFTFIRCDEYIPNIFLLSFSVSFTFQRWNLL